MSANLERRAAQPSTRSGGPGSALAPEDPGEQPRLRVAFGIDLGSDLGPHRIDDVLGCVEDRGSRTVLEATGLRRSHADGEGPVGPRRQPSLRSPVRKLNDLEWSKSTLQHPHVVDAAIEVPTSRSSGLRTHSDRQRRIDVD